MVVEFSKCYNIVAVENCGNGEDLENNTIIFSDLSGMYPQVFEIRIDDDNTKKYYAGQVIEGRVILVLGKEKVVRGKSGWRKSTE